MKPLLIAALLAYPVVSHYALAAGRPEIPVGVLAAIAALCALDAFRGGARQRAAWLAIACAVLVAGAPGAELLVYAQPVVVYLMLLAAFGSTLRRGREPLISWFARIERGVLTPELEQYTRRLTWVWSGFFALMAAASVALAVAAPVEVWSLFSNFVSYLLVALLFLGEYAFRRVRFRHYSHLPPLELARRIRAQGLRPGATPRGRP